MKLTAVFDSAPEGGYTCFVEEVPGTISKVKTLDDAKANLRDALTIVLACQPELKRGDRSRSKYSYVARNFRYT